MSNMVIPLTPKFILTLEEIFRKLRWEKAINIDGRQPNNSRYSEDLIIVSKGIQEF